MRLDALRPARRPARRPRAPLAPLALLALLSLAGWGCGDSLNAEEGAPAEALGGARVDAKADLPLGYEEGGAAPGAGRAAGLRSLYLDFVSDDLSPQGRGAPWDLTGCLVCGRETGFLPTPTLTLDGAAPLEGKETSYVSLSWGAVEGATSYRVVVVQVRGGEVVDVIDVEVSTTTLGLGLELGYDYFVYVVASDAPTKRRSEPSEPLLLTCAEGDVCAQLDAASIGAP